MNNSQISLALDNRGQFLAYVTPKANQLKCTVSCSHSGNHFVTPLLSLKGLSPSQNSPHLAIKQTKESVWRITRKEFIMRAKSGLYYFCSHPIGFYSVIEFHLTARNAGKCSLYVQILKKMGWDEHLAFSLPQGH